ncbi:MAG TPA: 50S ribosomal protein L6 [Fibrobacteria bacterium]|nr:50S ribosomal protein L6 [Fibrobacteria bacterium]HOX50066.1 50S ribosomal protein L6 [Fibrobacteria bacterium]
MSRVGKNPVGLPDKVKATLNGRSLKVEGPKGALSREIHPLIDVKIEGNHIVFTRPDDLGPTKALHGTQRALAANMVKGVSAGFKKELEIIGVGYRVEQKGTGITMFLGYSHPVNFTPPKTITVKVEGTNKIIVEGADKQEVGQVASVIRGYRAPEPYKGKGVKYSDETIRRKAGKKSG